jgi:putative membrane protein
VLFLVAGSHDILAKLMYAQLRPTGGGSADEIRTGAQVLFYGGDVVELMLAVGLFAGWYARTGRVLRHERRRFEHAVDGAARVAPGPVLRP